jgi:hypothetical protein
MHGRTFTKIKNDFDNAFGYDMLFMKSSKASRLPDRMDSIFKMLGLRYENIAVQNLDLVIKPDIMKINTSDELHPGKLAGWPLPFMN